MMKNSSPLWFLSHCQDDKINGGRLMRVLAIYGMACEGFRVQRNPKRSGGGLVGGSGPRPS